MIEKRGRGRPRKTSLEKDEKKIKQLFTPEGHLLKNDELEEKVLSKIEKIELTSESLVGPNLNNSSKKLQEPLNSQIASLESKLVTLDCEYHNIIQEVSELEEIKDRLLKQRLNISDLIEKEENLILAWENALENLSDNHFTAHRNGLIRWFHNRFGFLDEISLRSKISESETIISQWKSELVKVNALLSEALVGLAGHRNVLEIISSIRDSYRAIRLNLGSVRREISVKLKNQQTDENNQLIIQNYLHSLENLKNLAPTFSDSASKNNEFVAKLLKANPDKLLLNLSNFSNFNQIQTIEGLKKKKDIDQN